MTPRHAHPAIRSVGVAVRTECPSAAKLISAERVRDIGVQRRSMTTMQHMDVYLAMATRFLLFFTFSNQNVIAPISYQAIVR